MAHNLLYPVDRCYLSAALIICWFTEIPQIIKTHLLAWRQSLNDYINLFFLIFFFNVKKHPEHNYFKRFCLVWLGWS